MDKKYARENVKDAMHMEHDLYKHHYKHAEKVGNHIEKNIEKIRREIHSGKARRER